MMRSGRGWIEISANAYKAIDKMQITILFLSSAVPVALFMSSAPLVVKAVILLLIYTLMIASCWAWNLLAIILFEPEE